MEIFCYSTYQNNVEFKKWMKLKFNLLLLFIIYVGKAPRISSSKKPKLKEEKKVAKEIIENEEPIDVKEEELKDEEKVEEEVPGFILPEEEVEFIYLNTHYSEQAIRDWHRYLIIVFRENT